MRQHLDNPLQIPDAPKVLGFQKLKGCYIIDYDCIMTKYQLVDVLKLYSLVEFTENFGIKDRTVMFWHASVKDGILKIIVYDINIHEIVKKTHNISKELCDWFLYDKDILNDELLAFEDVFFHKKPMPKGEHTDDINKQ